MRRRSRTRPRALKTAERRARALDMRKDGATYEAIGKELKISAQAAWKIVTKYLKQAREQTDESVSDLRDMMKRRLLEANESLAPKIREGDHKAIDTYIRLQARLAALHGLDAPTKTELSGPNGGPIETQAAALDLSKLTIDELRIWKRLAEKVKAPA